MKPSTLLIKALLPILMIGCGLCGLLLIAMLIQTIGPLVLIVILVALAFAAGAFGWGRNLLRPKGD